jgi:hypothetical protein
MGREELSVGGGKVAEALARDLETIDAELQLVAAFRRRARERGAPLPSIAAADALLDERLRADCRASPLTPRISGA